MPWISESIDKEFTAEHLEELIVEGEKGSASSFPHIDIVNWCQKFCDYHRSSTDDTIRQYTHLADDVVVQWELYLASRFTISEMKAFSSSNVVLPKELFSQWRASFQR